MIYPTLVKYYARVSTKNAKGQVINTFPVVTKRFMAAVKPLSLTQVQSAGWTVINLAEDSRFMAFPRGVSMVELDRVVDAFGKYYEIKAVNPWKVFPQALLVPVQGESAPVSVDGVSVAPTTLTLALANPPYQLVKTLIPALPTNPAVTWSSSAPSKATVDASGLVTPVAIGSTLITVTTTDGGFTASCTVTVTA